MAKHRRKKRGGKGFVIFMVIYALVFLGATAYGLHYLWGELEAYEAKEVYRDQVTGNPMDAYMEQLTAEHIVSFAAPLLEQVDTSVQSEEQCRQVMLDALKQGFSRKKYVSSGITTRNEYAIFCGERDIGKVTTESHVEDRYGFTVWEVAEEEFDLSWLITDTITIVAPHDFTVTVGGVPLGSEHIIDTSGQYELLSEFYEDYTLPYIVTYEAGPFLGEIPEYQILDKSGNEVIIDENTDWNVFVNNCTEEEQQALDSFLSDFLDSYVAFTSSKEDRFLRYDEVIQYMVKGGKLADRMKRALDGLQYNKIQDAYILSIDIHHRVNIGQDRYLCDLTYEINTKKDAGYVVETNSIQIIILDTSSGLRAESMTSY